MSIPSSFANLSAAKAAAAFRTAAHTLGGAGTASNEVTSALTEAQGLVRGGIGHLSFANDTRGAAFGTFGAAMTAAQDAASLIDTRLATGSGAATSTIVNRLQDAVDGVRHVIYG